MTWEGSLEARRLLKSKSYAAMNGRRVRLIHKEFSDGLTPDETRELEHLQACVGGLVDAAYPLPGVEHFNEKIRMMNGACNGESE